jgi:pyridoxamine 5'-phosphate oxidase-like protein
VQNRTRSNKVPQAGLPYMPGYDMMFDKNRKNLPWKWAIKRLSNSHNYWFISTRPDGRPHSMPVWGVWVDGSFFFSTGKQSRKSKNLQASPNCVVCPEGAAEAVIVEGVAEACSDPSVFRKFARVYKKKYDWDIAETKDPVYRVRPLTAFGFIGSPGKIRRNPTRWIFPKSRSSSTKP